MSYRQATGGVVRISDGAFIPADTGNRDWTEFLRWVAQGNTATPARSLDEMKAAALERMQRARDAAMDAGYTFNGQVFHSDKDAIRDVLMALTGAQMASGQVPETIPWKLKERSGTTTHVALNLLQLGALFEALTGNMLAIYGREEARMASILEATTAAEVEAVRW